MNKTFSIVLSIWILALGQVTFGSPDPHDDGVANAYCPVTLDEEIDPDIYVEHDGERVFFCCNRCRKKFLANPDAYQDGLAQVAPPVQDMGVHDEAAHGHAEPAMTEEEGHDHARDHDEDRGQVKVLTYLGKFHPLMVHFPIALILVALFAEGLSLWRGSEFFAGAARFVLTLGALSAVVAAGLGWLNAAGGHYPADLTRTLFLHRWIGVSVAALSMATAVLSYVHKGKPRLQLIYRVCLVVSAALVGGAGHLGASLIFGTDYFTW